MTDPKNGTTTGKTPPTTTWAEAAYRNTQRISEALEPLKLLAEQAQDTHQPGPVSMLVEANRLSGETDQQILEKLDRIIELLAAPSVEKALRDMAKG